MIKVTMDQETTQMIRFGSTIPKVLYSKSLLFPLNLSLTLRLNLTLTLTLTLSLILTQMLALWHVSAQWTFGVVDLQNSRPVPMINSENVVKTH